MAIDDHIWERLAGARIVADPRKFRDYALVPGMRGGKDHIFLNVLGFRARNQEDAWALARLYEGQARTCVEQGNVQFGMSDLHGHRCTIEIIVRDVPLRTGWILRPDNTLWLATPFCGYVRASEKG